MLIRVNGLDYEATAALLGVPVGTVRSRLGRARKTLRRELCRPETGTPRPSSSQSAVLAAE